MITFTENEKIILMLRRHWVIISLKITAVIIFAAIPFIIYPFVIKLVPWFSINPRKNLLYLIALIYYMFLWLYFFLSWLDYYLDVWIVTNKRIVDIEQKGLFSREVSEFSVYRVQDVTVEVRGIFPTLFHYGDVHIQTAGEARQFIFKDVPDPYKVKDEILMLQNKIRGAK
jgi:uncharacterized membrane protein YdbT with pleckstrin-like domain